MTTSENKKSQSIQIDRKGELPNGFQQASSHFNLGRITAFERLSGNMNKNYSVVTENGDTYIFKAPIKHPIEDLRTEVVYLDRLQEHNFPAVYYIKDGQGSSVFQYSNDTIMVQPKLKGSQPPFTKEICSSIGKNIARLHQIPSSDLPERDHWLKESFLSRNISLIQSHLPDKAQRFQAAFNSLANFEYSRLAKTIVHGDLYETNCLYEGNDLVAILDWEETGIAPAVLDLATCVFNFCFEDDIFHPELYKTMIDGYQLMRSLDKLERESMNLALKYVGLTLASWRLVQFGIYAPNPAIAKRSEIYWDIGLDKLQLPSI